MGHFPFFMEIAGKKGVIVGGGKVAARKVEKLLPFGPALMVVAPRIEAEIRMQEKLLRQDAAASFRLEERAFREEDLAEADFVIAATDDEELNGCIAAYCKAERIPVNVVDDREKCTFFFPALVKRGNLTIGISTDGKSPLTAAWTRQEISDVLPEWLGEVIDLLGRLRPMVMERVTDEDARKEILKRMFLYCMEKEGRATPEDVLGSFQEILGC